jgi:hypothetical protein
VAHSDLEILSETEGLAKLIIPLPWKVLRNLWNEWYPQTHEWHYHKKQEHRFSRDFYRGQEAVIGTQYGLPGIPNQPMTEAEVVSRVEQMKERLSQAAGRGATFTPIDE